MEEPEVLAEETIVKPVTARIVRLEDGRIIWRLYVGGRIAIWSDQAKTFFSIPTEYMGHLTDKFRELEKDIK